MCCSDDTVLTLDTGTGEIDFHIRERQDHYHNVGDELAKCGKQWPQIDRQGIYKELIQQLSEDLTIAMEIVRPKAAFITELRSLKEQVNDVKLTMKKVLNTP